MALTDALHAWDEAWRATGAPVEELIAPGFGPDQVRAALGRESVHPDVLTWFGWHNGGSSSTWNAAPAGRWLASVGWAVDKRDLLEDSMSASAGAEGEAQFSESYLPVLIGSNLHDVFVDVDTGAVFRWDPQLWSPAYPEHSLLIGEDLESVVRIWVEALADLRLAYTPGQIIYEVDRSRFPADLRDRMILLA